MIFNCRKISNKYVTCDLEIGNVRIDLGILSKKEVLDLELEFSNAKDELHDMYYKLTF